MRRNDEVICLKIMRLLHFVRNDKKIESMKLKVCGMKYLENIQRVAELQPDYLGFIFYEKSKRNFDGIIPELPKSIKKVGVFVNETIDEVLSKIRKHDLQTVQLHGDETVTSINELRCQFEPACGRQVIPMFRNCIENSFLLNHLFSI